MQRLKSDEDTPLFIRKDRVVVLVDNIGDDDIIQAPLNFNMDNRSRMNFAVAILIIVGDARCLRLAAMSMAIACVYSISYGFNSEIHRFHRQLESNHPLVYYT
jgi:hypothetical protein